MFPWGFASRDWLLPMLVSNRLLLLYTAWLPCLRLYTLPHRHKNLLFFVGNLFFFGFEKTSPSWKAYFVSSGEGVKPRLFQALTRSARPDSNSRPAVQISNSLPSHYALWDKFFLNGQILLFFVGNPSRLIHIQDSTVLKFHLASFRRVFNSTVVWFCEFNLKKIIKLVVF